MSTEYEDDIPHFDPVWERFMLLEDITDAFRDNVGQTAVSISASLEELTVLHGDVMLVNEDTGMPYPELGITLVRLLAKETDNIVQVRYRGLTDPLTRHFELDLKPTPEALESELTAEYAYRDVIFRRMLGCAAFRLETSNTLLRQYLRYPVLLGPLLGSSLLG